MSNIIFALLTIFLFSACEYDSDNIYYKDLEKPKDIQIGVYLARVSPYDTIYIYANTYLYYSLNTLGKETLNQEISINTTGFTLLPQIGLKFNINSRIGFLLSSAYDLNWGSGTNKLGGNKIDWFDFRVSNGTSYSF